MADRFSIPRTQYFCFRRCLRLLPQGSRVFILFRFPTHVERSTGSACEFSPADVAQNGKEPRLDLRAAERIEMSQRAQIALLRSVFGIGVVAEQISRQRIDVIEMGQHSIAKTPRL